MRLRLCVLLFTLSTASAAMAVGEPTTGLMPARPLYTQPFWEPEPFNPVEQASQAFGHCVTNAIRGIDAAVEAEAAAASVINACAMQLHQVERETEQVIAAAHWPEHRKDVARAELRARLDQVAERVSARIRQARSRTASAR